MRASLCVVLLVLSTAAQAADLGTLFFTAREREQFEKLRRGDKPEAVAIPRPDPVITGYVKRSDGKSTVFIDKQPVPVRNPRLERRLEPRAVDRFDPLPMPAAPPDEEAAAPVAKPVSPPAKGGSESAESRPAGIKAVTPATGLTSPPAPRKRAEKDE